MDFGGPCTERELTPTATMALVAFLWQIEDPHRLRLGVPSAAAHPGPCPRDQGQRGATANCLSAIWVGRVRHWSSMQVTTHHGLIPKICLVCWVCRSFMHPLLDARRHCRLDSCRTTGHMGVRSCTRRNHSLAISCVAHGRAAVPARHCTMCIVQCPRPSLAQSLQNWDWHRLRLVALSVAILPGPCPRVR